MSGNELTTTGSSIPYLERLTSDTYASQMNQYNAQMKNALNNQMFNDASNSLGMFAQQMGTTRAPLTHAQRRARLAEMRRDLESQLNTITVAEQALNAVAEDDLAALQKLGLG